MARQIPPKLLGVLKTDEDAPVAWIRTVWRLPSGGLRIAAQKAAVVGKTAKEHALIMQMDLVDINGDPIGLDKV